MLKPVASGPSVVVCNTCRDGDLLAEAMREQQVSGIAIQDMPCLFACGQSCAVHIRAPGRIGYVLGGFVPGADAARAILGYAAAHAASPDGDVPYDQWPEGVKGHFITRTPPDGFVIG